MEKVASSTSFEPQIGGSNRNKTILLYICIVATFFLFSISIVMQTRQRSQLSDIESQLVNLEERIDTGRISWPKGSYCILANGDCAEGFERLEGRLNGVRIYTDAPSHFQQVIFGSSAMIDADRSKPTQFAYFRFTACCK